MTRARSYAALLAASVLITAAGCGGEPPPRPRVAPSSPSSASATAEPSASPTGPAEPALPPEAKGDGPAAAEAFVRHYWEMVNYAQATGDVAGLRTLAADTCDACRGGLEGIAKTYAKGATIKGGRIEVRAVHARRLGTTRVRAFGVDVEAFARPQVIRHPDREAERFPGGEVKFQFIVERDQSGWSVARWDPRP